MEMDKRTAEALGKSITHWQENYQHFPAIKTGAGACALCNIFNYDGSCYGCPVYSYTKKNYCVGTPYDKVEDLDQYFENFSEDDFKNLSEEDKIIFEEFRKSVKDELDFLISLRAKKFDEV